MEYLKFLIISSLLLMSFESFAQVQTEEQCQATVRARAPISLSSAQVEKLCEEYAMVVIDCALSQTQSRPLSADLNKSLRRCRLEHSYY